MSTNYLPAAWWTEEIRNLPIPPDAKEVEKEVKDISSSEFTIVYYISPQGASSIKDFYHNRLSLLGWRGEGLAEESALAQHLIFEKDSKLLTITFMPEGSVSNDGNTHFTISLGKITLSEARKKVQDKAALPLYSGASLLVLPEQKEALEERNIYSTKDNIEQVVSFYKAKMPDYGWLLVQEGPIKKLEISDPAGFVCPSCPKNLNSAALAKSTQMLQAKLVFSHQKGDTCRIILHNIKVNEEASSSSNTTTISVHYEKNK